MATEIATLVFEVDTKNIENAKKQLKALGKVTQTVDGQIGKVKGIGDAGKASAQFGRKAAMAGIQFEQMAGQIAMGQNPMRAVGVQAADLGFVLGTPLLGAIVGISAAIGSVMIPMLLDANMGLRKLNKLSEELTEVFKINEQGVVELAGSLDTLKQQFGEVADLTLTIANIDAFIGYRSAVKNLIKDFDKLTPQANSFGDAASNIDKRLEKSRLRQYNKRLAKTAEKYGISVDEVHKLEDALVDLKAGEDGAAMAATKLFDSILSAQKKPNKALRNLAESIRDNSKAFAEFNAFKNNTIDLDKQSLSVGEKLIKSLNEQFLVATNQERELLKLKGITEEAEIQEILRLRQAIKDEKARTDATKKAAQARKKAFEDEMRAHDSAYKKLIDSQNKAIDEFNKQQDDADRLMDRLLNEEGLIRKSHDRRREEINANTVLSQEQRKALITESEARMNEELLQMQRDQNIAKLTENELYWATWLMQAETTMTTFNDVTKEGIEAFETGFGSAFEKIIMDGEGLKSVVSGIFESMARSQIAALGQMAAEQLTQMLVGKALAKTAAASGAAAMIANATAQQQMAGLAAFASTAAIPITGPLSAPAAQAAAIAATTPAVLAITGAANAGATFKATGGQVFPDRQYIVGERGPELLTMAGGQRGRITPNHMMGGEQLKVTVENYGSSNISVQKISETDVRIIAREVASQTVQREAPRVIATDISNPNGRVSKTLANKTSTQRRR
jgi:hypothetical protein